jgi:hypothetical protein
MKRMNIVISIIIAAAVLVAAYGVGLVVRHARTQSRQPVPATVGESPATVKAMVERQRPGGKAGRPVDANMAAQTKAEREQMIEKMKNMTKEEKRRFMDEQVGKQFGTPGAKRPLRELSPEERDKIVAHGKIMSAEEEKAFEAQKGVSPTAEAQPPAGSDANGATPPQNPGSNPKPGGSEPNKAGPG